MADSRRPLTSRRDLFRTGSALFAGSVISRLALADGRPPVTQPRATAGDTAVEPDWRERLTITVGPNGLKKADLVGDTDKVIQAAVDYVGRFGGGTVHVLPGTYRLRNAVRLTRGVRLLGSGTDSVLMKEPMVQTKLAADSDWYDQEITVSDAGGLHVGDGVCIQADNPFHSGKIVLKRTLVARNGNRFKLDRALREDVWVGKPTFVSTLFPLTTAEETTDFAIEGIALDGNRANNARLDGNYAGCIWLQDCARVVIRDVAARNFNGDGISFQICHDMRVEDCRCHDNADLGLHPGSGAQRPVLRGNRLERNTIGLFFCWGVQYGLAERNTIHDNRDYGISIGHRDHNNLIRDNEVVRSGKAGVLFRPERGRDTTARGNVLEGNRIIDSGPDDGIGIDVQGATESNTIARNEIRETRKPASRLGIRLGPETRDMRLIDNHIEGFAVAVSDLRRK